MKQQAQIGGNILGGNAILYLIMAPGIIFFLLFSYLPMVGMVIAFKDFNLLKEFFSDIIGFKKRLARSYLVIRYFIIRIGGKS
jgi:ABC-type polysaccharide transport system permease subunit